jgi:hypothetical protein
VRLWNHLRDNISWLAAPLKKTQELEIRLAETKLRYALPGVKNLVGQESIDFFGYEPGYLLLNDLNYTSRPMPMTFATANKFLEEANEHFYRNPAKAPQFVLCQSGGVDNRLFIQDDALTKRALLDNYRPVIIENGLLLFKRKEITDWIPLRPDSEVKDQVIKFGQSIPLEKMNKSVVWLEVDIKHTLAGKLMTFFYKTPPCYINVQFEGEQQTHSYKFVTTMGDCGFMINPYLGSTSDIASYFDQRKNIEDMVRVASLSFEHNKLDRLFFKDSIHLKLRLLERPKN